LIFCAQLAAGTEPAYRTGAYHGGALIVTDPMISRGHLAPGQVLPIRLSRLTPPADPALPPRRGAETPGSVRYGQLVFQQVSPAGVTFTVAFHEAGEDLGPSRTVTLHLGDSVDLTGDGLPDLALQVPVKALTVGTAAVDYALLSFPCDAAHTAMFALAPEAFAGSTYPYGISGVTAAGNFIFRSDSLAPAQATLASAAVEPAPGDVMVEARSGRLRRIDQVQRTPKGLDLHFAAPGAVFLFQQVFSAASVRVSGTLADLGRRYRCGPARPGDQWDWQGDLVDLDLTEPLMDDANGKLDVQVTARLSVELSLTADVNYYGMSSELAVYVDEALRLAADYRADQPWSTSFGPVTLADPEVFLVVNDVPMSFRLTVDAGLDLDDHDTGALLEGITSTGRWGWDGSMDASWSWRGIQVNAPDPVATNTLVIQGLPENQSRMDGLASVRPWVRLSPKLGLAGFLYGECPNTLSAATSVRNGASGNQQSTHAQEDASCQLEAGFTLELPVLGQVWERTWPLFTTSATVWSQDWLTPCAAKAP
jgi:hypothetical protein